MNRWKVIAGSLALAVGLSGAALAQPRHQDRDDHDYRNQYSRDHDRRDREYHKHDRDDRRVDRDRDNGYYNNGYYRGNNGWYQRGDNDGDEGYYRNNGQSYPNGAYYPDNGRWGYGQGRYHRR